MAACTRCCLHKAMRIVNLVTTLLGIGIIIYSLWLIKMWNLGVAQLPPVANPPRPWFMYTCLLMGIAVSLITLSGQMIRNCVRNSTLCIYIFSVSCLVLVQAALIVAVFYKMNWSQEIAEYVDEDHQEFKTFLMLHLTISRLILLMILVPQIKVAVLACTVWVVGTEASHGHDRGIRRFTQSFLVGSMSDLPYLSTQSRTKCASFYLTNLCGSFSSYVTALFRMPFRRRVILN